METSVRYAITLEAAVPMRKEAAESSEMVSQLLFGETIQRLEEQECWVRIRHLNDGYEGWISRKMVTDIDSSLLLRLNTGPKYIVTSAWAELCPLGSSIPLRLSMGAILPFFDPGTSICSVNTQDYILLSGSVSVARFTDVSAIVYSARQLLNVPYLWGGRCLFGMDCSGFTQVVYGVNGIKLPRDAKEQALAGRIIDADEPKEEGDLAFFRNSDGRIVHVGILMSPTAIIHASGRVRIDRLDEQGIFDEESGEYTHRLDRVMRPFRLE